MQICHSYQEKVPICCIKAAILSFGLQIDLGIKKGCLMNRTAF